MACKAVVFGSDHRTLKGIRNMVVIDPLLAPGQRTSFCMRYAPCLGPLESRRLRIDYRHQRNADDKKKLQGQQGEEDQAEPAQQRLHASVDPSGLRAYRRA